MTSALLSRHSWCADFAPSASAHVARQRKATETLIDLQTRRTVATPGNVTSGDVTRVAILERELVNASSMFV